ncbi:MAG: Sec-independent protein translocase protein tatA/E-like protein [Firmicutes bacterium]|nr:Sec-independent protein translocase protein tatA/E-like protein [Bacillota bacterium]
MLNFSMPELGVILVIALIVFGPGKLPEAGKALGKGLSELRQAVSGESSNTINIESKATENKQGETK